MDKLFYKGLARGNFREWGPSQFQKWHRLVKKYATMGFEIEDYPLNVKCKKKIYNLPSFNSAQQRDSYENIIGTLFCNWCNLNKLSFHSAEQRDDNVVSCEVSYIIDMRDPIRMTNQIVNLMDLCKEHELSMTGSLHLNLMVSEDVDMYSFSVKTKNKPYISFYTVSRGIAAYTQGHANCGISIYRKVTSLRTIEFPTEKEVFPYVKRAALRRLENKSGIASYSWIDWIRQIVMYLVFVNFSFERVYIKNEDYKEDDFDIIKAKLKTVDEYLLKHAREIDRVYAKDLSSWYK